MRIILISFYFSGYWGTPTFNSAFFVSMITGVITSAIESIGDYYTCAKLAGALPPHKHAVNRGTLLFCDVLIVPSVLRNMAI